MLSLLLLVRQQQHSVFCVTTPLQHVCMIAHVLDIKLPGTALALYSTEGAVMLTFSQVHTLLLKQILPSTAHAANG